MTMRRRNNAPIRPRPGPPAAADFAIAVAGALLVMAGIFVVASMRGPGFAGGTAGADLARLFAAALAIAGGCLLLIGILLVVNAPNAAQHITAPAAIGAMAGALEAAVLLAARPALAPLPLLLFVFVPAGVRRFLRPRPQRR